MQKLPRTVESKFKRCKRCGQVKKWILVGKFDEKNKKWQNEDGLTTNGNVCGLCHKQKARSNMQKLRRDRKITCSLPPKLES